MQQAKKKLVFKRDNGRCQYCGSFLDFDKYLTWHIDHVVPRSKGGGNDVENLKLSCRSCNSSKSNRSLKWFRSFKAIKQTPYGDVISAGQAEKLISLGVEMTIPEYKFHFERVSHER